MLKLISMIDFVIIVPNEFVINCVKSVFNLLYIILSISTNEIRQSVMNFKSFHD